MSLDLDIGTLVWARTSVIDRWQTGQVVNISDNDREFTVLFDNTKRQQILPFVSPQGDSLIRLRRSNKSNTSLDHSSDDYSRHGRSMRNLNELESCSERLVVFELEKKFIMNDIYTYVGDVTTVSINPFFSLAKEKFEQEASEESRQWFLGQLPFERGTGSYSIASEGIMEFLVPEMEAIKQLGDRVSAKWKRGPTVSPDAIKNEEITWRKKMPPHAFSTADFCFRKIMKDKKAQSVIVSGESGAGKTEAIKFMLEYLSFLGSSSLSLGESKKEDEEEEEVLDLSMRLTSIVMSSNSILEAFGNAIII
jgi:myosin heavy subunit